MADSTTVTPAPAGAAGPSTTPGPGQAGRADIQPNDRLSDVTDDQLSDFGLTRPLPPEKLEPTPAPDAQDDPNKKPTQPAGDTPAAEAGDQPKKPDEAKKEAPTPWDAEVEGLEPLAQPKEQSPADYAKPEELAKALNPDGKASVETQLQNAQQVIGRQSSEVKRARDIEEGFKPFIQRNPANGEIIGIDFVKLGEVLGREVLDQQYEAAGLKLVPLDDNGTAEDKDMPADLVNQIVKDKDLNLDEKRDLIRNNSEKMVELQLAKRDAANAERARKAQHNDRLKGEMVDTLKAYEGKDKSFEKLLPSMRQYNDILPDGVGGKLRGEILYRLAKLDRLLDPQVRKAQSDAIYKQAEQDIMKKFNLSLPGGGGGGVHVEPKPGEDRQVTGATTDQLTDWGL